VFLERDRKRHLVTVSVGGRQTDIVPIEPAFARFEVLID
jgi:hypothetical protein